MSIRYAALTLSIAALATASPSAQAQTKVPGWTYAFNITVDSGTGKANRGSMAMRYQVSKDAMRMEIVQISGTSNRITEGLDVSGMYTLINDADSTYTQVMPAQRMAMIMTNPIFALGDRKPTVDVDAKSTPLEDLGAGDKILGHPTHHYRSKNVTTMTVKQGDAMCTRSTESEVETWIAPDVDMVPAMLSMVAHLGGNAAGVSAGTADSRSKGFPLRTKTRETVALPNGESRVVETTHEYVELSNAPLDASLFTVPADYQVMDMRKQMAGMMAQVMAAEDAKGIQQLPMCK